MHKYWKLFTNYLQNTNEYQNIYTIPITIQSHNSCLYHVIVIVYNKNKKVSCCYWYACELCQCTCMHMTKVDITVLLFGWRRWRLIKNPHTFSLRGDSSDGVCAEETVHFFSAEPPLVLFPSKSHHPIQKRKLLFDTVIWNRRKPDETKIQKKKQDASISS